MLDMHRKIYTKKTQKKDARQKFKQIVQVMPCKRKIKI